MMPLTKQLQLLLGRNLVMVYTMGKVASTAVENNIGLAFHTHTLYGFPPSPPYHRLKFGRVRTIFRWLLVHPLKRMALRRRPSIQIVTFYRDPVKRNPSMFMQDLPYWLTDYLLGAGAVPGVTRAETPDLLVDAYRAVFPHDYPEQWVNRELSRFTGIAPQELMLGADDFRIVKSGRYKVFVGRAEAMEACRVPLAEFLGLDRLEINETNRGEGKWYAPLYATFQDQLAQRDDIVYCESFRRANGYSRA